MSPTVFEFDRPRIGNSNTIFKSGHLLKLSKGLGWKPWKKRWFILTRTALVFFRNDPSALPHCGGELNQVMGGIKLNNSGRVVVREYKKLLNVLFRDGWSFTLKSETSEDLYEWKTALEHALAQAPNAALVMGQDGIFRSDTNGKDNRPVKSLVVGRPILLALEDTDGGPSFLEKALRFLEKYGIKVEGILRQSASVAEVDRRVQEYEQGKTEFDPVEDAHIIGDCVKHVLRELPSSPVPASCCTALLQAYKEIDRKEARVNAMRSAILETFPEPNRRLLQRVLKMMHTVSSHASENRMTPSAVAICMAPLLLRPLLTGECELENGYDTNEDGSAQLLAAANAANAAQAIITTLLEEYDKTFDDYSMHRCSISVDSKPDNSGSEDTSDDENADVKVNGYHDAVNEVDPETDIVSDRRHSGKLSESSGSAASDLYDYKAVRNDDSDDKIPMYNNNMGTELDVALDTRSNSNSKTSVNDQLDQLNAHGNLTDASTAKPANESQRSAGEIFSSMNQELHQYFPGSELSGEKMVPKITDTNIGSAQKSTFWGKKNARKTLSSESIDSFGEEGLAIQRLEIAKNDLRHRISKEARGNAILQVSQERRKQALLERRLVLEQDVARLQEQLQAEIDLRAALEVGLSMSSGQFSGSRGMDSKTRAELEEIALAEADVARLKQKVAELHNQLNQQRQHHSGSLSDACDRYPHTANQTSQKNFIKHGFESFDTTFAVYNRERRQRTEESMGSDERNIKGQLLPYGSNGRPPSRKQLIEPPSLSDSKSTETSTSLAMDDFPVVESSKKMDYRLRLGTSSALVELTSHLDFVRARRSQLMEQLHNLDPNHSSTTQDSVY
ncbi:rho GTPase-activating protein 7-like isoform X1 [Salvia splendens]|uniref:rho GTPase-activating protein 7-like isoform X1 n=1 Tax=Salvia splendens TaxID=180675 RepID=UPI001C255B98|nr:rho GTPase-activating protein 7-like isoform X1 [Salvia splendens]